MNNQVMDAVTQVLEPGGDLITLIKPQFEAEREEISRGGLVRSERTHARVTKKITEGIEARGFELRVGSPITGAIRNLLTHCVPASPEHLWAKF